MLKSRCILTLKEDVMILKHKPNKPTPLLIIVASFDPTGEGVKHFNENDPSPLYDINSPICGEQWAISKPEEVYQRFFGDENSLEAYYKELSHNKFWFYPCKVDHPTSETLEEGVVCTTVNSPHPSILRHFEGYNNETAAQKVIHDIVKSCEKYIDFEKYDTDSDGIVRPTDLAIIILNAGFDASSAELDKNFSSVAGENGPWASHRYMVHGTSQSTDITMDSRVKIIKVSNVGEYRSVRVGLMTIGTPAHELAHNLGAQDMYSRWTPPHDRESRWPTPRRFSLMCSGSHIDDGATPGYLDPYHRIYFGWADVVEVDEDGEYTLYSTCSGKYNVLKVNTPNKNEFFYCEIRLKEGFEKKLDGTKVKGGVVIWHIDERINKKWFLKAQCVSSNRPNGKRHDLGNAIRPREGMEKIFDEKGNFVKFGPLYADDGKKYNPYFYKSKNEDTSIFKSELYCGAASGNYSLNKFPKGVRKDFCVHIEVLSTPGEKMKVRVAYYNKND